MVIGKVNEFAKPLDPSDYESVYNLCYVTSNGNHEVSKTIAEVYKKSKAPVIKVKNSPTNKSYITSIKGFEFPANLLHQSYSINDDLSAVFGSSMILLFDHKVDTSLMSDFIVPINDIARAMEFKLIVLAPSYDSQIPPALERYRAHEYNKDQCFNLIPLQYQIGKMEPNQLEDLATVLKGTIITQEVVGKFLTDTKFTITSSGDKFDIVNKIMGDNEYDHYQMIGVANISNLSYKNGSVFQVTDLTENHKYNIALALANKELADIIAKTDVEKQAYSFEVGKAQARISQLKMENYIYYVGSDSTLQTDILYDSVDDVVKCVRSAVKSGIVPGCQLSILRATVDLLKELIPEGDEKIPVDTGLKIYILEIIKSAVIDVYKTILQGPDGNGIKKLIPISKHVSESGEEELNKLANDSVMSLIRNSVEKNQVFDMESLTTNDKIITSTETDINVLMASSELIKLLISGNQCVFLDSEINDAEDKNIDVYA
jgi:hypothetical protein